VNDHDTILSISNRHGAAAFMVKLRLDVEQPDLRGLDELLAPSALIALSEALASGKRL